MNSPLKKGDFQFSRRTAYCPDYGAMTEREMKERTRVFAIQILDLIDAIPDTRSGRIVAGQLGPAGTSVGSNYRAACRSRSSAEMISKISSVEEEAGESGFWLGLITARRILPDEKVGPLSKEAGELTAILVASRKTLQRRMAPRPSTLVVQSKIENPKSKI